MSFFKIFIVAFFVVLTSKQGVAAGSGAVLYNQFCSACHSVPGMSYPLLFGLSQNYLINTLVSYKRDTKDPLARHELTMRSIAVQLSNTDIMSVANYLSTTDPCSTVVSVNPGYGNVEAGRQKATSCRGCHGYDLKGAEGPRLAGQRLGYLINSIAGYRAGVRKAYSPMNTIVANFTDQDIADVAAYMNSLRSCSY